MTSSFFFFFFELFEVVDSFKLTQALADKISNANIHTFYYKIIPTIADTENFILHKMRINTLLRDSTERRLNTPAIFTENCLYSRTLLARTGLGP